MSTRSALACVTIVLASTALYRGIESSGDAAAPHASPFEAPPAEQPRIYSLDDVYAETPTQAVSVQFRVLSTGTHHTERYAAIHDAASPPIILSSSKAIAGEKGPFFQVVLIGDALAAVENLGLDSLHFKNRVVKASGIVHHVQERWRVGPRGRYEIVVDDLKQLEVVSERAARRESADK